VTPQEALAGGRVIGIPTDTVYGLACLPDKPAAVARIFELKKRGRDLSIPVLCADIRQAAQLGRLPAWAGRAWPGATTLVVRRTAASGPWDLGDDARAIALRVPDHPLVQGLAAELGPIATSSANLHGEATPDTAEGVLEVFGSAIELVVDGGRTRGRSSTVVDCRVTRPRILRQGDVQLGSLLG
jgi:tRNA threonylcarbamoyl adenosine modification protein (Sua5/YciO/YrdC/YwlC family)